MSQMFVTPTDYVLSVSAIFCFMPLKAINCANMSFKSSSNKSDLISSKYTPLELVILT